VMHREIEISDWYEMFKASFSSAIGIFRLFLEIMGSYELLERNQVATIFHKAKSTRHRFEVMRSRVIFIGPSWTFCGLGKPVQQPFLAGQVFQGPQPCSELGRSRST
jgi:hypothetical protein